MNICKVLLAQNDHILILGYYTACSWSFGNWQPRANLTKGPAAGNSCQSQSRQVSPQDTARMTQWEQAIAVGSRLNARILQAVTEAVSHRTGASTHQVRQPHAYRRRGYALT